LIGSMTAFESLKKGHKTKRMPDITVRRVQYTNKNVGGRTD